jgi:hypothetical protein
MFSPYLLYHHRQIPMCALSAVVRRGLHWAGEENRKESADQVNVRHEGLEELHKGNLKFCLFNRT